VSARVAGAAGTGNRDAPGGAPAGAAGLLNVTVTQIFAVKGRLGQQVTFTSIGSPFLVALEQRLSTIAVDRP